MPSRWTRAGRLRIAAVIGLAAAGSSLFMPPAQLVGSAAAYRTVRLPRTDCAQLIAMVKASRSGSHVGSVGTDQCTVRISSGSAPAAGGASLLGAAPADAATACDSYYKTMGLFVGPWEAATARVNVGMCRDGQKVWVQWGPDCKVTTNPGWGSDVQWCGVYNNGAWYAEPGENFDVYAYSAPWWKRNGYMRFRVYGDGRVDPVWGQCCQ